MTNTPDPMFRCGAYVRRGVKVYLNLGQPPELDGDFELEDIEGVRSQVGKDTNVYINKRMSVSAPLLRNCFELVVAAPETPDDASEIAA